MTGIALTLDDAHGLIVAALTASRTAPAVAETVARALVAAEIDGQGGHGLARVPSYAAQARAGKVDGFAHAVARREKAGFIRIDAMNGFAFPAIDMAIEALPALVAETGIAAAAIARSHHCGQLGAHVERLAGAGVLAIMVANAPKAMAPWGGSAPLFGTNPIAFAAPREGQPPLVVDLSLSRVARGKVMAADKRGEPIPEGWALDAQGNPTTDAKAALAGTMVPAGDAKGAALALLVEILAATVTGSNYSYEASSFFDAEGDPPGVGQFIIALEGAGGPRLEALLSAITAQEGARLPGQRRLEGRARAAEQGITITPALHAEIVALAG